MRLFLVFIALVLPVAVQAQTVSPTPAIRLSILGPSYPKVAREANITGSGICEVVFDYSGHVGKATMTKSTGSNILDRNTIGCARRTWIGKPNSRRDVPIVYQMPKPVLRKADHLPTIVKTPEPPYPYEARAAYATGTGACHVVFDANGFASHAVMVRSTGYDILDGNTMDWAKLTWVGPPNTMVTVPITYKLE